MKLSDVAVIVVFGTRSYNPIVDDKRLAADMAAHLKADEKDYKVKKRVIAKEAIDRYRKIETKAWSYLYRKTVPWETGQALLTQDESDEFVVEMEKHRLEFEAARAWFVEHYPELCREYKKNLGEGYDPDDYLTPSQVNAKFEWKFKVFPLGETGKHSGTLGRVIDATAQEQVRTVMRTVWARTFDCLARLVERLETADKVFRNSLIGNIQQVLAIVEGLHLDDPTLVSIQQRIADMITGIEPETLRESIPTRTVTERTARAILKDLEPLTGLDTERTVSAIRKEMEKGKRDDGLEADARPVRAKSKAATPEPRAALFAA